MTEWLERMAEWLEHLNWFNLLFTLFGVTLVASGVRELITTRRFLEHAQRTEGTIISWRSVRVGDVDKYQTEDYPTVRFLAPDGRTIETEAELPLSKQLKVDTPVTVLFNPADPNLARVATHGGRGYLAGALSLFLGLCVLIFLAVRAVVGGQK